MDSLHATNALLTILTVLGIAEALSLLAVLVAVALLVRRIAATLALIEARHIAPAAERVRGILDDVRTVTSETRDDIRQICAVIRRVTRWIPIPSRWSEPSERRRKEASHA